MTPITVVSIDIEGQWDICLCERVAVKKHPEPLPVVKPVAHIGALSLDRPQEPRKTTYFIEVVWWTLSGEKKYANARTGLSSQDADKLLGALLSAVDGLRKLTLDQRTVHQASASVDPE
jgi:hypothetical protein